MLETTRIPVVAGHFYTAVPQRLRDEVLRYTSNPAAARAKAYGVMVPHAGYVYSGAVCGRALASVEIPGTVLILHTKHQLGGGTLSLAEFKQWQTPLGVLPVDTELNKSLAAVPGIDVSSHPHFQEHAAEVVLPFLQVLNPAVKASVISVSHAPFEALQAVADGIAKAILGHAGDVLVIASSDLNHYEDQQLTLQKDQFVLDKLAAFDARGMLDVCYQRDVSMCGAHATTLMLQTCKALGASRVEVLEHTTSGDVSGDMHQVVGYASVRVL